MAGTIEFGGITINCVVLNMSISGAALDVISPDISENFRLVFQADGVSIPCHIVWRKEEHIGLHSIRTISNPLPRRRPLARLYV